MASVGQSSTSVRDALSEQYVLVAKIDDARVMASVLRTIHFKEMVTMCASPMGIKATVENARCLQANAFLQSGLFYEYCLKETVSFKISLTVLLDCLTIFGSSSMASGASTSLKLCYGGYGTPLTLLLEEGGMVTNCSIRTLEPDELLDFNFNGANVNNKIILKSECLKDAFGELDMSSEFLEILMSPDRPYFRLSTFGDSGTTLSDLARDSDMIEAFQCVETMSNRYKISLLKPSVKALAASSKVSMRTDTRGFLSMQYMIQLDDGQTCFVEYYCAPDEDVAPE